MIIRAIIVDDEPLARELIRDLLGHDDEIEIVAECGNGREALAAVRKCKPDLLFLDIQMPAMNGFDVLARLAPGDAVPYVIFVTAFDRYAIKAFEVQAVDYLLKPLEKKRFYASVERAKSAIRTEGLVDLAGRMAALGESYARLQASFDALQPGAATAYRSSFRIRDGRKLMQIDAARVVWIEAANQYVRLHTEDGEHLLSESMSSLQQELDPRRFCRIHRSTIVNAAFVREVRSEKNGACSVLLPGGRRLRVSRGRRAVLDDLLESGRGS